MLSTVHADALNLLAGGWKPEDYEQIKDEYELTENEACEICEEMERIIGDRIDENDISDMRYREARENGELDYIFS